MKTKIVMFALVVLLMMPMVVSAATNPCINRQVGAGQSGTQIGQCISQVYIWSLGLSGLLSVAMVVFGGYLVMSARGNGEQASRGKSFIYSSLAGMVLLLGAYILLNTVNSDLTNFTTPDLGSTFNPAPGN